MLAARDREGLTVPMHALLGANNLIKNYGESARNYADDILTRKIEKFILEAEPGLAEKIMSYKDNRGANYLIHSINLGVNIKPLIIGGANFHHPFWKSQAKSVQEMFKSSSFLTNEMVASMRWMPARFANMVISSENKEEQADIQKITASFLTKYQIADYKSLIETSQKIWATETEERLDIFAVINKSKEWTLAP
jgi:hypothetical protein